jgi:N6-L-threonylcarbamoyladenine synthase
MKILGVESSCDETAAAVVENGSRILANVVNSQIDLHKVFGGVVPEVAARSHIEVILPVVDQAVRESYLNSHPELREDEMDEKEFREKTWGEIDAIACTTMPGLVGSLLIGSLTARTLALAKNLPLYPIHHVEAHVYANFILENENGEKIRENQPRFPMLSLIVSGGHSQIVLFKNHGDYELIGQTQDDAVGEAFDKVAKILGLPYPGGPSIAKAAESGDPSRFHFPKAKMSQPYDFSFSGLKTAVLRAVQSEVAFDHTFPSNELSARLDDATRDDFAASFQFVAVETLVDKVVAAVREFAPKSVVIAGGVAANQELRKQLREKLPEMKIEYPPRNLCTDNAAMVASLGFFEAERISATDPRNIEVLPSISMTKTAWLQ